MRWTRATLLVAALVFVPAIAPTPAKAQDVTFAELEGAIFESAVVRNETTERGGKQSTARVQSDVMIVIGPGGTMQGRNVITSHGSAGVRRGGALHLSLRLERPGV